MEHPDFDECIYFYQNCKEITRTPIGELNIGFTQFYGNQWDKIDYEINSDSNQLHEANLLKLDCSKAHILLKWRDVWNSQTTFEKTVNWYKSYYEENKNILTSQDLDSYVYDAKDKDLEWSK